MEKITAIPKGWGELGASAPKAEEIKIRYCLYARKSTESEEQQVLSIDSQIKEMLKIAERDHLELAEVRKESHSAKAVGQRKIFNELVADLRSGKFNGILTWAPDRLSRNAGDLGSLVDLMDQKLLLEIRTFSQKFTNSPSEKFMLMILCSQAKLENDNKSENVKRGLRTRCEQGLRPSIAPTGYLNEKRTDRPCEVIVDPVRAPVIKQIFEKVAYEQWAGRKLYHWLKSEIKFRTKGGKPLSLSNIYIILRNPFYCGIFEYPLKSGNWYSGKQQPIIPRELFDKVQEQLHRDFVIKSELKEFAFTKLITCGLCGSGITASEKYKSHKDGSTARYVYYGCSRSRDKNCQCGYIREDDLIVQLLGIVDQIDISEIGMREKFTDEVERHRRFMNDVLGQDGAPNLGAKEIDLKTYAKYLLRKGSADEKRELLSCFKSRLTFSNKTLSLQK
jgi:DNA invertase Pin-like site-specific DNA recombinase